MALWLVATVASTAMVWAATSIVAADVTDRPAPVVAHDEVVSELEAGSSVIGTTTTSTTNAVSGPAPTVPASGQVLGPAGSNVPSPGEPPPRAPQAGLDSVPAAPPGTTRTTPAPRGATVTAPGPVNPASPPAGARSSATYSTDGGVVRVACTGVFIDLVSAIPSNGYTANVVADGPENVDVRFVGSGQELSVKAVCSGEPIRYYGQTPPRRVPGSP